MVACKYWNPYHFHTIPRLGKLILQKFKVSELYVLCDMVTFTGPVYFRFGKRRGLSFWAPYIFLISPYLAMQWQIKQKMKIEIWKVEYRKSRSGKFRSHKSVSVKSRPQPTTPAPASVVVHSLHWMMHQSYWMIIKEENANRNLKSWLSKKSKWKISKSKKFKCESSYSD